MSDGLQEAAAEPKDKSFGEFLRSTSPEKPTHVTAVAELDYQRSPELAKPPLELPCEKCGGLRFFDCTEKSVYVERGKWKHGYMHYHCRNCRVIRKTYALAVILDKIGLDGNAFKFGELPAFGDPLPPRVFTLIGPDKELFLQGRRSENRGLGIGALTYYRRVVANQWKRIVEEVSKVAKKLDAKPEVIEALAQVATHTQFGRAVDSVKPVIPEMLLIDGHNPLTLLHSALSEAIHDKTDEECLAIARDIRIVLAELAERSAQALKDHAELKGAVSRLQNRGSEKRTKGEIEV
jgi:hypothetical protein